MTKYLDSKGLSYLWQKIRGTYVAKDAVIKLGDDATGISLVPSANGKNDSWTLPFATHDKTGVVRTGDSSVVADKTGTTWHKAPILDGYVWYENTLADPDTVTSFNGGTLTDNYVILGAGNKEVKQSAYQIGAKSYTAPVAFGGTNLLATEEAVKEYVDDVAGGVTSGLQLSYTTGAEGTDLAGKQVIKLTDTNNSALKYELDATPFIKDGMLESVQILKYTVTKGEGEGAEDVKEWKTIDGNTTIEAEDLISAPANPGDNAIWMYFVWKTVHHDSDTDRDQTTKTASWLPATDLIKECTADTDRGIGADANNEGGNKFYVKTTGLPENATANVSTGFDDKGNVVGYVDVESYLEAFDKTELDAIFTAADALYEAETNGDWPKAKNTPAYPEVDPLATA